MSLSFRPKTLAAHCIKNHNLSSLTLLVENGCSTQSLLLEAIAVSDRPIFDFLLSQPVDINELTSRQLTPLNLAVSLNHLYFVTCLLEHGADMSIPDGENRLPIYNAVVHGSDDIVASLLAYGSPMRPIRGSELPVLAAIKNNHLRILSRLLEAGADPENTGHHAPLRSAAERQSGAAVRLLLAVGAPADGVPQRSRSSLKGILSEWDTAPNPSVDISERTICTPFEEEFRKFNDDVTRFVQKTNAENYLDGFLTPLIGEVNSFVVRMAKLAGTVELHSRKFRKARLVWIKKQFKFLAQQEKKASLLREFVDDEASWRVTVAETVTVLQAIDQDSFPGNCAVQFRTFLSQLDAAQATVFGQDAADAMNEKEARAALLGLNAVLEPWRRWVQTFYETADRLCIQIRKVLDQIEKTLTDICQLIANEQQMNFEFEKVRQQGVPSQMSGPLQDRKEMLILDTALVSWEKRKFVDISEKLLRLLRYCIN